MCMGLRVRMIEENLPRIHLSVHEETLYEYWKRQEGAKNIQIIKDHEFASCCSQA